MAPSPRIASASLPDEGAALDRGSKDRERARPGFTTKQGQYLAFIHAYTQVTGRPPAEAEMQRYFRVTPPSVHQMVLTLERAGLIRRQPGVARSIEVLVPATDLPPLQATAAQIVRASQRR
jgi:SOS-response transcriptional repressor LexA